MKFFLRLMTSLSNLLKAVILQPGNFKLLTLNPLQPKTNEQNIFSSTERNAYQGKEKDLPAYNHSSTAPHFCVLWNDHVLFSEGRRRDNDCSPIFLPETKFIDSKFDTLVPSGI